MPFSSRRLLSTKMLEVESEIRRLLPFHSFSLKRGLREKRGRGKEVQRSLLSQQEKVWIFRCLLPF